MSDLQETVSLIRSTIENFQIEPDVQTINQINENLSLLSSKRKLKLDHQLDLLSRISKQRDELKEFNQQLLETEDRQQTLKSIEELEHEKFKLAKSITDLEMNMNHLQNSISSLTQNLNELEEQEKAVISNDLQENYDSTVLRLKLFKSMGLIIDTSKDKDQIIIYNKDKGVSDILSVEENYSDFFVSNYVWDNL
ncbi:BA75_04038T0 [Komagataella pastoris]|uniref:Kinetochore protein Spc24 n=1 Tax=Komagataella pastoris TaxID=4922 RepID=A0A1B2JEJ1_PICPA|nr:BA75_04038T0 [Komagataella pastoris]